MTIKKFLDNFEEYFCVWTMAIMTLLVFVQVVMRYVFSNSLSWSEEMARFIFLWLSWIGASYAVKERSHFRVEMFANMIPGAARRYFEYFVLIVWFVFSFILAWIGTELVIFIADTGQSGGLFRRAVQKATPVKQGAPKRRTRGGSGKRGKAGADAYLRVQGGVYRRIFGDIFIEILEIFYP